MKEADELILKKAEIFEVMRNEENVLDEILIAQSNLHDCVIKKDWNDLESLIQKINSLSDVFQSEEMKRESLCASLNIAQNQDLAPVLSRLRGKLLKSKTENKALSTYIQTTREFINGVLDEVIPSRKNVTYGRNGATNKVAMKKVVLSVEA